MSKSMRKKVAGILGTAMIVGSMPLAANVVDENTEEVCVKEVVAQATSSSQIKLQQRCLMQVN